MGEFRFADRYAEAGLTPSAQLITLRGESAKRIVDNITNQYILDLAAAYYGSPEVDLAWLRAEFAKEDASFSLVHNEREVRVLAAAMLGQLVVDGDPTAILAVIVGNVVGNRRPSQSEWLLVNAKEALGRFSVVNRSPKKVQKKITPAGTTGLAEEIASVPQNDWAALLTVLGKIKNEASSSSRTTALQSTNALDDLDCQMQLMREESQMLWWLFGTHSRLLERGFATFAPQQAALVGAVDLGTLTTKSTLGPIAAPAMLERVIALAKKAKGQSSCELSATIDSFTSEDLERLKVFHAELPPRIAPVTAAIDLARTIGVGAWHARFNAKTGLDASFQFDPLSLAEQLYREYLLGQLL